MGGEGLRVEWSKGAERNLDSVFAQLLCVSNAFFRFRHPLSDSRKFKPSSPTPEQFTSDRRVSRRRKIGVFLQHSKGHLPSLIENTAIPKDICNPEVRHTGLTCAEKIARSTDFEISLGDSKTVAGGFDNLEPLFAIF